jgi:hypothetical protein
MTGLGLFPFVKDTSVMAESSSKVPVRTEKSSQQLPQRWEPFERFRREMDRLFDDFSSDFWRGWKSRPASKMGYSQ